MRPLFLSIEGLQSFQEKQTIDFEKIGRDGLFGIFGPTGSGKSTIIDGMTLALYGSIIRFKEKASETKDSFDIEAINKNCDEASVNFKFKVGENIYRVERNYKIGKKSRKLSKSAVLFKTENGEEIKIAENYKDIYQEIKENILGLTLEDFTRSVVLPQGNFSQFLKIDGKEKRDMLERIFNLEKYGDILSKKANSHKYTLENQIKELDIELNSIGFNSEELSAKEKELEKAEEELENLKKEEQEINKKLHEMEETERLETKLADLNREKNILENQREEIKIFEEKIALSEKFIPIIEKIHKRNQHEEKIDILNKDIEKNRELFETGKEKLEKQKEIYSQLESLENQKEQEKEKNYISQEEFIKASEEYKNAIKKEELSKKKEVLEKETEIFSEELKEFSLRLTEKNSQKENIEKELAKFDNLSQDNIFALEKELIEKENILRAGESKLLEIKEIEKNTVLWKENIETQKEKLSQLKTLEKEYLTQKEKYFIYELEKNLHEGDICPLCKNIYSKDKSRENAEDSISLDFDKNGFEKNQDDIREVLGNIHILEEKIKTGEERKISLLDETKDLPILSNEIKELENKTALLKEKFETSRTEKIKTENLLKEITAQMHSLELSVSKTENQISLKTAFLKDILKDLKSLEDLEERDSHNKKSVDELGAFLEILKDKNKTYKTLEKELSEIRKEKKDIYNEKIVIWSEKIRDKERELIQKEQNHKNLKEEYLILSKEIDSILLENKISDLEQLNEIESCINDLDKMKEKVETFKNSSILVLNKIVELKDELKDRKFLKEEYEKFAECGKIVKMSLEKNNQIIGEIRKSIEIFNKNRLKAEKLLKAREDLELKLNPAKELAELLKGRKFLDFLSAGKLQSITRIASNTLQKITNGRYRINVDEKSDFSIIDNFNSSIRKPQSLSGGETFMVSLCLALALADQIQLRGKSRLEFFFLDEGFGTLDSELLELVFSVLENLKAEGMTVGIITHVEEIKNRIARKLMVTPAKIGESGTIVREI